MRRFLALTLVVATAITLAAITQIAFAGPESLPRDSSKDKEVMAAPAPSCFNWTGFYLGVQGGGTTGNLTWKDVDFGDNEVLIHHDTDSFLVGGEVGYNHQFGSWLVLGIEGDFSWFDGGGHKSTTTLSGEEEETVTDDTSSNWIGTIGLRVGVPFFNNRLLPYVKGGVAFEDWNYHSHASDLSLASVFQLENDFQTDETRVAPMVGVGLEYAISCHWSVKAEYKHLFLGTETITGRAHDPVGGNPNATEPESFDVKMDQDSVTAGLNYKF